jgi:hypothetical protein
MRTIAIIASAAMLTACASRASDVPAAYVSPALYQNLSCAQLAAEAQRVSHAAAIASGQQERRAGNDAIATGVGLIIFWPALFFIKGDGATSAELSRLRGEAVAIEQAATAKGCGIQFHQQS